MTTEKHHMPQFIAEVSSNHHQDLDRCHRFIQRSAQIGCQTVKFQLFKVKELFTQEVLEASEAHRKREAWELPVQFLPEISSHCKEEEISFACTPFYLDAVEELVPYVDIFKIASYEILWDDLLIACAKTSKPVVLSTGMATMSEIRRAVDVLRENGCRDLTLLHCVSAYPVPPGDCNLSAIETIRNELSVDTGWSDHSVSPAVIYRAVHTWDAKIIEFHLDLDTHGQEYQQGHCWLPEQIEPVIETVKTGYSSDGTGNKAPTASELEDRPWRADPEDGLRPLKALRGQVP